MTRQNVFSNNSIVKQQAHTAHCSSGPSTVFYSLLKAGSSSRKRNAPPGSGSCKVNTSDP